MARYTGPKHKLARREGVNLLDKASKSLQRRLNIPPGMHGKTRRRRLSEFGLQLREKQKAKAVYSLLEKQFKKIVEQARSKRGDAKELIIATLETSSLKCVIGNLQFSHQCVMTDIPSPASW